MLTSYIFRPKTSIYSRKATIDFTFISINYRVFFIAASYIFATSFYYRCDGARARHLVRGSLRTWHMYIDVASPPSLAPHLDIFVIQHSFASPLKYLFKPLSRHLFNGSSRHNLLTSFNSNSNSIYNLRCEPSAYFRQ